jgi:hypothetical protein
MRIPSADSSGLSTAATGLKEAGIDSGACKIWYLPFSQSRCSPPKFSDREVAFAKPLGCCLSALLLLIA